jgi:hypothetical protein
MESDARRQQIAREAKALVALTFRNGPIEEVHAGRHCPTCAGNAEYSRITDEEMKAIIKNAVDQLYALLVLKIEKPDEYERRIQFGERYTAKWDDPTTLKKSWTFCAMPPNAAVHRLCREARVPTGVVKNDAHRVTFARTQATDAMPHIHAIEAASSLNRPVVHRERHGIALKQRHDFRPRLHSRTLYG